MPMRRYRDLSILYCGVHRLALSALRSVLALSNDGNGVMLPSDPVSQLEEPAFIKLLALADGILAF